MLEGAHFGNVLGHFLGHTRVEHHRCKERKGCWRAGIQEVRKDKEVVDEVYLELGDNERGKVRAPQGIRVWGIRERGRRRDGEEGVV